MRENFYIILLLAAAALTAARGQEHYVSHWGSHTPPFDSWATAATNLMDALDAAPDGATIWVTNGVYRTGSAMAGGLPCRLALTRPLTVRGVNGYSNTVIEGAFHAAETPVGPDAMRAVYATAGTLDGFTIRRGATLAAGAGTAIAGGGLYADGGTQLNIRVTGNYGQTAGGAWLSDCHVADGIFQMNFSQTGPRVKVDSHVHLEHCRLNNAGMMFPAARVLGTNGAPIINGDHVLNPEHGTDFGEVAVVDGERLHTFTLTNMGVRPLLTTNWAVTGGHASDFTLAPPAASELAPGASATFTVTFNPSEAGTRRTALWMACNDPDDDPYLVWLGGTGIQAELVLLSTNYSVITNGSFEPLLELGTDFGDARVTSGVITNTFIITNAGNAALNITNALCTGADAADFALVAMPTGMVAPGGVTNFSVMFDPADIGLRATLLVLQHDAPDTPFACMIQGWGVEPELRVLGINQAWIPNGDITPSELDGTDFGMCAGEPIRHVFTITNAGASRLTLTNTPHVAIAGDHPADFTVTAQPATTLLDAGAITTFEIEFFPLVADIRTADVLVYSDDVHYTNAVYTFRITGTGDPSNQFIAINANIHAAGSSALAWGDYNNDGLPDLAVLGYDGTNRFTEIYENLGGGVFTNINAGIIGLESGRLAWGDYNNDGWLDLAIAGFNGAAAVTAIYRNEADGSFSDIGAGLTGAYNGGLAWGDYDNDGDLDLVVAGYTGAGMVALVYRNDGTDVFTPMDFNLRPVRNARAVWVDHDHSGWLDLLVTGDDGTAKTARLYKNYAGTLTNIAIGSVVGAAYGGLSLGDFDADGALDLAINGYGPTGIVSHVYRNTGGTPPYTPTNFNLQPVWLGAGEWGDFQNSGRPGLVLAGAGLNNTRHVKLYGNTNGALAPFPATIPGLSGASIAWGDYDADGDLDLALAGQTTNGYRSTVYRNLAPISNTPPTAPAGLSATIENGNEIVLSWEAATDAQTPSNALAYNIYVGTAANLASIMSPHADIDTGRRRLPAPGNVQMNRTWRLKNLPSGDIVWGVQAVDSGGMGGPFAHGAQVTVQELPDLVIAEIQVMTAPFLQASVTVSNRGEAATDAPVRLSAWVNRATEAGCGIPSDDTNTVAILGAGATQTIVFSNLPPITNVVTNTFRAHVNSVCEPDVYEERYDNNQLACVYTNLSYEPFWFQAVALTNDVHLRWIDPANIGMQSSEVLVRWSPAGYPATTADGALVYQGTAQVHHHTGLTPGQPCYYTIWVTHDGVTWLEPP